MCGDPEPELSVVAPHDVTTNRNVLIRAWRTDPKTIDSLQIFHVNGQEFWRRTIGLAHPERAGVPINRHQRTVLDRRITCQRPRRQFAGRRCPFINSGMGTGFLQPNLQTIATFGIEFDDDLIRIIRVVTVWIVYAEINLIAGLDLRRGPSLRSKTLTGFLCLTDFLLKLITERFFFLVKDTTIGHLEFAIGSHLDFDIRKGDLAKLLFEFIRVVTANNVKPRELQHMVFLGDGPKPRVEIRAK